MIANSGRSFIAPITEFRENNRTIAIGCSNIEPYDIASDFNNATIYPVLSVTYRVNNCKTEDKEQKNSQCLIRCYGNPFANDMSSLIDSNNPNDCQLLLKNVTEFDILPMGTPASGSITLANPQNLKNNNAYKPDSMLLSNVRAITFKISAYSERITPGLTCTGEQCNVADSPYFYDSNNKAHALQSIQGTALIKTRNMATGHTDTAYSANLKDIGKNINVKSNP